MRKFVHSACFVVLIVGYFSDFKTYGMTDTTQFEQVIRLTQPIKDRYAPDKRTAIFSITLDTLVAGSPICLETSVPEAAVAFKKAILPLDLKPTAEVLVLPDSQSGLPINGVVNLSVANMRVSPSNQAELATQALLGSSVRILKRDHGYYLVQTSDGYIAYMDSYGVSLLPEPAYSLWEQSPQVIVTADYGHVFESADIGSGRVSDLVLGDRLVVKGKSGSFVHVSFPDGRTGYVPAADVTDYQAWVASRVVAADPIIQTAKSLSGLPYFWGGTSVKGVDCSGFTKTAYFMNGLIIPRDASQQVREGTPVAILNDEQVFDPQLALRNLKPGDLLFFAAGIHRPADAHVTHVALYIGNGEFIHSSGIVGVNSFLSSASNYGALDTRTLIAARRFIGEPYTAGLKPISVK